VLPRCVHQGGQIGFSAASRRGLPAILHRFPRFAEACADSHRSMKSTGGRVAEIEKP
jgi:hypothetical protein